MDDRIRSLLQRGREHYRAGEYDLAHRCLSELADRHHPFADVYDMLGVIAHQRNQLQEAETMFRTALRLNPAYTEAALNLAVTLNDLGQYDEAREIYQGMMEARAQAPQALDPFVKGKIANMHADVADAYVEAGLHGKAIDEYRRALDLCPTFVDIRARLGAALRAVGDLEGAVRELEAVKKTNPRFLQARLNLGMVLHTAGARSEAEREWREVLALDPTNRFAKLYLKMV